MRLSEVIERLKKEDARKICPTGLRVGSVARMRINLYAAADISIVGTTLALESIPDDVDCYLDDSILNHRLLDYMLRDAYLPEQEDAHRLARVVLAGDDDAALLLADEVLLRNRHGKDYVPRDLALDRATNAALSRGRTEGVAICMDRLKVNAVKIAAETELHKDAGEARARYARENMMRQLGDRLIRAFESGHWYAVRLTSESNTANRMAVFPLVRMQSKLEITPLDGGKVMTEGDK